MKIVKLNEYQKEDLDYLMENTLPDDKAKLFHKFITSVVYDKETKLFSYWIWASKEINDVRDYFYYAMIKQDRGLL